MQAVVPVVPGKRQAADGARGEARREVNRALGVAAHTQLRRHACSWRERRWLWNMPDHGRWAPRPGVCKR